MDEADAGAVGPEDSEPRGSGSDRAEPRRSWANASGPGPGPGPGPWSRGPGDSGPQGSEARGPGPGDPSANRESELAGNPDWDAGLAGLLQPAAGECLGCYVFRMLGYGCYGLIWARRYRDLRAPRVSGLEARLGAIGGYCDCEIFLNGYQLRPQYMVPDPGPDQEDDETYDPEPLLEYPEVMPQCLGARRGSTKPCPLWQRLRR